MLAVSWLLGAGALLAAATAFIAPRIRWLVAAVVPAVLVYFGTGAVGSYVDSFIVKPNELVREQPYITHNIAVHPAGVRPRPDRRSGPSPRKRRSKPPTRRTTRTTLQNIRLWDWRVLQDTLRQLQEIRTYYDFPDIDVDRYVIDGHLGRSCSRRAS